MIQRLIPLVVLLLCTTWSFGQTPRNIQITTSSNGAASTLHAAMMCDAGDISFGPFAGQSNDTGDIVKYLCADDCMDVIHDENYVFNDPIPSTPSGIAYLFYDCPPTIAGSTIDEVILDNCANNTSEILVNNMTIPISEYNVWAAQSNNQFGDLKITNDGSIQAAFSSQQPIQFWFAPITQGDFTVNGWDTGDCVDVSIDQAFSIVYLNAVRITGENAVLGGGEFTVRGGLPEFDNGATNYDITIIKSDDPSIVGTITNGPAIDGSTVEFTVPMDGCYDITASDGKSCFAIAQVCTFLDPPFTVEFPQVSVPAGAMVCVSATVQGFTDIVLLQMSLEIDASVISYNTISSNPALGPNVFFGAGSPMGEPNIINISGNDLVGNPFSIADNETLFDVCFTASGAEGDCSPLTINPTSSTSVSPLEAAVLNNTFDASFFTLIDGEICIEDGNLNVDYTNILADCTLNGSGGFTITIDNGSPPYAIFLEECNGLPIPGSFEVTTAGGSTTISGLQAQDVCVTVTDSNIPSLTYTGTVTIPEANIAVNILLDQGVSCSDSADGAVSAEILINNMPVANPTTMDFGFAWTQDGMALDNAPSITTLTSGLVELEVTDLDSGCTATASLTLGLPSSLSLENLDITNPECPGEATGSVSVTISGGTGDYTYMWTHPNGTGGSTLPAVGAGIDTVFIMDTNGCGPLVVPFELVDPAAVTASIGDQQDVSCHDSVVCDGQMTVTGAGGNGGPYTFIWDNDASNFDADVMSSTRIDLCQGMHIVAISEGNCGTNLEFTIGAPDTLKLDIATTQTYQVSCYGDVDGQIKVGALGGTPNYTYNWLIGSQTIQSDTLSDLAPGSYTVTVVDDNGCNISIPLTVGEPDPFEVFVDLPNTTEEVECGGDENGVISVYSEGGNGDPKTYTWTNNVSDAATASGLAAGEYSVTVTDRNGCTNQASYTIDEPTPVVAVIPQPASPPCAGFDTEIAIESASGGSGGPYTFIINNNNNDSLSIANTAVVSAGEFLVSVFDSNGCAYEETITIQDPPPLVLDLGPDITIELGESTQLDGFFFGPNILNTISWSPNVICSDSTNNCLDPVVAPTDTEEYTLTVVDTLGCFASDNIIVEVDSDRNVYIPNAFTPDNDGINDGFVPFIGPGVENVKSMNVFDRWGELVFSKTNFMPMSELDGWNGTFRGKQVQTGVYVYLIEVEFIDGITLLYRGDILAIY